MDYQILIALVNLCLFLFVSLLIYILLKHTKQQQSHVLYEKHNFTLYTNFLGVSRTSRSVGTRAAAGATTHHHHYCTSTSVLLLYGHTTSNA